MRGGGAWTNGYAARHSPPKWEGRLSIQSTALPPHLRFLLFSDEDRSSLTLRWCRDLPLKRLSSRIRTSCSDQLAESVIPCGYLVRSKKALLEEQISAQHCCKCHAVIVRCAGIPCTLMTLTLSVCHAWGNDPKWRCAQRGWIYCEYFSLASLRSRLAFFSESDSTPRALQFSSSQGSVRKKTACRGFEQPVTSELMLAQCPRALPS